MKRAIPFFVALVVACAATFGSLPGVRPPVVEAAAARVWANSDSFSGCGNDTSLPQTMADRATSALSTMGFSAYETVGFGFTKNAVFSDVASDSAIYVMSHGDVYNIAGGKDDSAFLQDPALGNHPPCGDTSDRVYASAIQSHNGSHLVSFVYMATCYLGSSTEENNKPNPSGTTGNKRLRHSEEPGCCSGRLLRRLRVAYTGSFNEQV